VWARFRQGHEFVDSMPQDVVGALEYDPEIPVRQRHREFLQQSVVFKEVVPIGDPAVRAKIHQTYRMGYLKARPLPPSPLHPEHSLAILPWMAGRTCSFKQRVCPLHLPPQRDIWMQCGTCDVPCTAVCVRVRCCWAVLRKLRFLAEGSASLA